VQLLGWICAAHGAGNQGVWGRDTLWAVSQPTTHQLDAAGAAREARTILAEDPAALLDAWRFGVCQLIDDYQTARRHATPDLAAGLFKHSPAPCGDCRFDAALAALGEHLARRDSRTPPTWVFEPERYAQPWWFVSGFSSLRAMELVQSPLAFRKRGVFIRDGDLVRA